MCPPILSFSSFDLSTSIPTSHVQNQVLATSPRNRELTENCSVPQNAQSETIIESSSSSNHEETIMIDHYVTRNRRTPLRFFTVEEVKKRNTAKECWVIVDGKVYDVTSWIPRHPGGELLILDVAGMDVTDPFLVNHLPFVREKILPKFQIGFISNYKISQQSLDFRNMAMMVEKNEWYKTDYTYYCKMTAWYLFLFSSSVHCVLHGQSFIVRSILGALLMALFWQQIAFAGHDLGHMAVTHNRVIDNAIGIIGGNLVMGIALGWWKATHNVHHLVTNYLEYDPDIQHLPVIAVSSKFFQGIWSFYHGRRMNFDCIAQFFVTHQHLLFYPVMFVARFNLYLQSVLLLSQPKEAKRRGVQYPRFELLMLFGFHIWLSQLVRQFPNWTEAIIFVILSHGVAGILHLQICLSHFPMEIIDNTIEKPLEKTKFLQQQIVTCLDVDCHPMVDWFHGGLQFQTTHHLFPLLPRHKLRELTPLVEDLCRKHGLTYNKLDFWRANQKIISCLKSTADNVHPWLIQLLNAEG